MMSRNLPSTLLAAGLQISASHALAAGALAVDTNRGDQYGFAYNYPSSAQAEQRALSECGRGCRIVLRFSEGCGAYAADQARGSTAYGWATGPNPGTTQQRALQECRSRGGSMCIVRSWGCNSR